MPPTPPPRPSGPLRPAAKAAPRPPMQLKANSAFDDLVEDLPQHGKFLMLYSEAGMGKTTLAACFPSPVFITTAGEQGIHLYKQRGLVDKKIPVIGLDPPQANEDIVAGQGSPGWNKLLTALERFASGNHDKKTLIIDSVSGLQDLCFQHCASMLFGGDMNDKEFTSFFKGYAKAAEQYWGPQFLRQCLEIVKKGYNVILIAHSAPKEVENPTGPNYTRYEPSLSKPIWSLTKKDLHGVYFMGQEVLVAVDAKTKSKKTQSMRRFIGCSPSTYYIAKSWCTTEGTVEIDCGDTAQETFTKLQEVLAT